MTRWIPYPILTLGLLAMWLLLNQSLSPGQFLLGGIVAIAASGAMAALQPEKARIRSYRLILPLVGAMIADIVRSNLAVARIILSPGQRKRSSGFVQVPLELRNRYGLAVLACILTATPGTLWVEYDRSSGQLLVHVLDLIDEEEWMRKIKQRYERRLMEIFE